MKFFFDNCISPKLARAIHKLVTPKHCVVALRDKFDDHGVADTDWIQKLSDENEWIIVSGDLRIKNRPAERDVWRAAKLTTFFMAKGFTKVDAWEQVRWMIEKWPLIVEQAERVNPGAAFLVPRKGGRLTQV